MRRTPSPPGDFDLDHVGAEVGEVAGRARAREHRRHVDDAQTRRAPASRLRYGCGEAAVGERRRARSRDRGRRTCARVFSVHAIAVGRGDAAHELRVATFVDAVLGPRARIVLHARDLDDRDVARRRRSAARGCGACDRRSSRRSFSRRAMTAHERFAVVGVDAEVVVVALVRARIPRMVVPEHEHRRRSTRPRASSSHSSWSAGTRPRSVPGRTVSSTASVTPASSIGERARRRDRVGDHRVVVAAHVVHASPSRVYASRNASYSSSVPTVGEIALHDDRVGIERVDLVDRARVHHLRVRRLARRGAEDRAELLGRAEPAALRLAEVHVVDGRDRREQAARRARERRDAIAGSRSVGSAPSTRERVLGRGLEPGDPRRVVRAGRRDLAVADASS